LEIYCTEVGSISKREELARWAVDDNANHNTLASLPKLARVWMPHEGFPVDPRTYLKTQRHTGIVAVKGGCFYHFTILKSGRILVGVVQIKR